MFLNVDVLKSILIVMQLRFKNIKDIGIILLLMLFGEGGCLGKHRKPQLLYDVSEDEKHRFL